jgi:hypothetical protein
MADNETKRKRRGLRFVVKVVVLSVGAVIAIAIAGDDELRSSLKARLGA